MITNASSVWQRTPDDGEAIWGAEVTVRRVRAWTRDPAKDAYGCVDWFDFEPAHAAEAAGRTDEPRRRDEAQLPA